MGRIAFRIAKNHHNSQGVITRHSDRVSIWWRLRYDPPFAPMTTGHPVDKPVGTLALRRGGSVAPAQGHGGLQSGAAGLRTERPRPSGFRPATPRPVAHRFAPLFAALDLGTNNCRLLVARPAGPSFRVIDAFSRIVRLGEGLTATGALSTEAMGRTLDALKICAEKIAARNVA